MPDAPAIPGATPASPPNNSPFAQPINPEAQRLAAAPAKEVTRIEAPKPVTPGSRAWAEMSPDQRYAAQRTASAAYTQSDSLHTRTPDGRLLIDGKLADGSTYQPDGQAAPADSATAAAEGGEKFKVGEFEVSEQEVRDMLADKSMRDMARTQIPADPKGYKIELPADVALPGDAKITFGSDPDSLAMIEAAQTWAHKKGLSQSEFSELLSIQAHSVAAQELKIATYAKAEVEKLGANGPQRIDALTRWIRSQVGDADAKPIIASMATAAHVRFYEKMFGKVTNPGGTTFNASHRVADDGRLSEEVYNTMSYGEKKAYAERMQVRR